MYVLLPDEGVSTDELISGLSSASWNSLMEQMVRCGGNKMDINLPRFSSSYEADLIEYLQSMGIHKVFTPEAQLSYMANEKLFVSTMKQSVRIDVDESGTKTATQSVASGMYTDSGSVPFVANRPFVYLIQEKTSGAIFFAGTYMGD